ncbi:ferredoxin reductase-like protein [Myriangium duriaei CBS 260.36]|uniref:Ferredoxin reductase-like protein n=1 Tax=Myriangium duriaei CBS 260.36 TaxID=1168546 RepID=A0A9P4JBB5_9PEZI|nr:ferredoxin reductase-like protein [Myriangium duriaei CBS 260.36]
MTVVRNSTSHEERTATQSREKGIELVTLRHIERVNDTIRLMRLYSTRQDHPIKFLAGQWLDVFLPGLSKAGGFTITSTPREAQPEKNSPAYLELAIQKSRNPPAQWLWRPVEEILNQGLRVRVGGDFTWPPTTLNVDGIKRLVLVAGGVGINPLISILAHLMRQQHRKRPDEIVFIYGTKASGSQINADEILFLPRLKALLDNDAASRLQLKLFLTGVSNEDLGRARGLPPDTVAGRITESDLEESLGEASMRDGTVCYVCGPQVMTDTFVEFLASRKGMTKERVLCEKWW